MKRIVYIMILAVMVCSCAKPKSKSLETLTPAAFSADSAYLYVAEQVFLGARVPGSVSHAVCAKYLEYQLSRFGAMIEVQQGEMVNYAGETVPVYNITGRYNAGQKGKRIMLCAHWDCRPWADEDPDYEKRQTNAVTGANDGASGVGVLLEIARQLGQMQAEGTLTKGVDITFFDVEDMGAPSFFDGKEREDTWCLGSQLWAKERGAKLQPLYQYAILLDMVGSPDAVFPREYISVNAAKGVVDKVWKTASLLGYGKYFIDAPAYPITDDHYYVNTLAGIPCIDIIHYDPRSENGFAYYWHTTEDDMRNISPETLGAVGTTVLTTILAR